MSELSRDRNQTTLFEIPPDPADPQGYLHAGLRVVGGQSRSLGTVESVRRNAETGHVESVTVRHGLFGRGFTTLPASKVKWVNNDSVVLDLTRGQFKRFPSMVQR
jgi:sporulation protein YlmC with PRC-barrel domain